MTKSMVSRGFTLVDILLSTALAGVVVLALSQLWFSAVAIQTRAAWMSETDETGFLAASRVTEVARNADAILSPAPGASAASLSLDVAGSTADPTVFDVSGGALRVTEGASAPVNLTDPSRVRVTDFFVENVSAPGIAGAIRVRLTLVPARAEAEAAEYEQSFYVSATLR